MLSHTEHSEDPSGAKVLAGHETQERSGDIVYPRGQMEHSESEEAPIRGKCLPAVHATQVPLTAGHVIQLPLEDAQRMSEYLPSSQLMHVSAEKAPSAVENLPAVHWIHKVFEPAPLEGRYVPAGHWVQLSF